MGMELTVNRLLAWAKLMEQALHGHGLWTFRTSGGVTPALRLIDRDKDEVVFYGDVIPSSDGMIELWLDDELMTVDQADLINGGTHITWRLRPRLNVTA